VKLRKTAKESEREREHTRASQQASAQEGGAGRGEERERIEGQTERPEAEDARPAAVGKLFSLTTLSPP
jgi:hypothetical protein